MQDIENKDDMKNADGRVYELGFLLVPTISEENMPIAFNNLKDLIADFGGEIISDEMPKMISLAYTMFKIHQNVRNKFNSAYFGWIKFETSPEKIPGLNKKLDFDQNLVRFLILKTVRENTIAAKRFVHKDSRKKILFAKREGEAEISSPIDKEEIDKEIDAMVGS